MAVCARLLAFLLLEVVVFSLQEDEGYLVVTDGGKKQVYTIPLDTRLAKPLQVSGHESPFATAIDPNPSSAAIFWTDGGTPTVPFNWIGKLTLGPVQKVAIIRRLPSASLAQGIAIDFISKNIYFTDAGEDRISVIDSTGTFLVPLIWDRIGDPRGIALDPIEGLMFWVDWGDNPRIERAYMDGSGRRDIVSTQISNPNDVAVDIREKKLYWVDSQLNTIEVCDYDGAYRRQILTEDGSHYSSLAVGAKFIYFTDWSLPFVRRVSKNGTGVINFGGSFANGTDPHQLNGIALYTPPSSPQGGNGCSFNKGGCHQVCAPVANGARRCMCGTGYVLSNDGKSCVKVPFTTSLVYTDEERRAVFRMDLGTGLFEYERLGIFGHSKPAGITYDPVGQMIYWSDPSIGRIARGSPDGATVESILSLRSAQPENLAFDPVERLIYAVDAGYNEIGRYTENGTNYESVIYVSTGFTPKGLALDHKRRKIYWTYIGDKPRIMRANMADGSDEEVIVSENIQSANAIALDVDGELLYFVDDYHRIEVCELSGANRRVLVPQDNTVTYNALAIHDVFLYIAESSGMIRVTRGKGQVINMKVGRQDFQSIFGLVLVDNAVKTTIPPNVTAATPTPDTSSTNLPLIIGVAVAGLLVLGIVIGVSVFCCKRRRPKPDGDEEAIVATTSTGRPSVSSMGQHSAISRGPLPDTPNNNSDYYEHPMPTQNPRLSSSSSGYQTNSGDGSVQSNSRNGSGNGQIPMRSLDTSRQRTPGRIQVSEEEPAVDYD